MAMKKRARNVTMDKSNKTDLVHFSETVMWIFLRPIDTAAVDPQN